MGVQQTKKSKSKTRMRRAHQALTAPGLVACPNCGDKMAPHKVCPACGFYKGVQVFEPKEK